MKLEELQAIWATQTKRPIFSVNDFGLHFALYQLRERARRRLFWGSYFIDFVGGLIGLWVLFAIFAGIYFYDQVEDFPVSAWDGLALLVATIALVFCLSSIYASRRKHEKEQSAFAPSLRQEIERGIAQVDFEIFTATSGITWRNLALVGVAAIVICWEGGRLNGDPLPWNLFWIGVGVVVASFVERVFTSRQTLKRGLQRKQALEGLRAKLDENPVI